MKKSFIILIVILVNTRSMGQKIDSVVIGNQIWMKKNLDVSTFNNGDTIPEVKTDEDWIRAAQSGSPTWCYFNNEPENGKTYGKLYNWYAVMDPRGLAPTGWHIPSEQDWQDFIKLIGGIEGQTGKIKNKTGWLDNTSNTNSTRFSALPGAWRAGTLRDGVSTFEKWELGTSGRFWSSTSFKTKTAWTFGMKNTYDDVDWYDFHKGMGLSVRCIKNL